MTRETTVFQHSFFKKFRYALGGRPKIATETDKQQTKENIYDCSLSES